MFFELGVTCVNFGVLHAFQNTKIETKQIFSVFFVRFSILAQLVGVVYGD